MTQNNSLSEFIVFCKCMLSHSPAQRMQDLWALWESGLSMKGYFVEFGALNGKNVSNTYLLEQLGWSGIVAEPHPNYEKLLKENRSCFVSTKCVYNETGQTVSFRAVLGKPALSSIMNTEVSDLHEKKGLRQRYNEVLVETISLKDLLIEASAPKVIDFLSIDTEGSEPLILEAFDFDSFLINCICVEHNDVSRQRLFHFLTSKGYERKWDILSGHDDWYVRKNYFKNRANHSIEIIKATVSHLNFENDRNKRLFLLDKVLNEVTIHNKEFGVCNKSENIDVKIQKSKPKIKENQKQSNDRPTIETAIDIFRSRWPNVKSNNQSRPIFIFSAGWRSGSTFLQRLLLSSGEVALWGEPYNHACLVQNISESVKCITESYPRNNWISSTWNNPSELTDKFVANLYPDVNYFLQSHIEFFENLFLKPAIDKGVHRWGLKEVRLSLDHAIYLNWLFPNSKFVFLYRNPYHAYQSYKGAKWYKKWPTEIISTSSQFGEHWRFLLEGYLTSHLKVDSMLLKYEDLCSESFEFERLNRFLDLQVDTNIVSNKVSGKKESQYRTVSLEEFKMLQKVVDPLASDLGYFLNSDG